MDMYNIYIHLMVLINDTTCVYHCLGFFKSMATLMCTREHDRPETKAVELSRMVYES